MKRSAILPVLFAAVCVAGFFSTETFAADEAAAPSVPGWLSDATAMPDTSKSPAIKANPTPAAAASNTSPNGNPSGAPSASAINNNHSLDEIIYKISRAESNLQNLGSDLGGHASRAIEHLKKAQEELQQARQ